MNNITQRDAELIIVGVRVTDESSPSTDLTRPTETCFEC